MALEEKYRSHASTLAFAMAASCFAAVLTIFTAEDMSFALSFSMYSYSVSIPALVLVGAVYSPESKVKDRVFDEWPIGISIFVGYIAGAAGHISFIFNIDAEFGWVFVAVAVVLFSSVLVRA